MTGHITVNTLDLTLEQLDEAQELVDNGKAGRNAATVFVALKGTPDAVTIEAAKALTFRQVRIVEDDSEPEVAELGGVTTDPTSGQ
jgi:hypothetical protein